MVLLFLGRHGEFFCLDIFDFGESAFGMFRSEPAFLILIARRSQNLGLFDAEVFELGPFAIAVAYFGK